MDIILYSNDSSYYSMIARLVLAEKNVKYTMRKIDIHIKMEQFSPEYVKIQPNMTAPTLTIENDILDGSEKILFYVNEKFTEPADLYPTKDQHQIQESLKLHYDFSIEDLTMGNAIRKSPVAKFAMSRGLSRASQQCRKLMTQYPEFSIPCQKKLNLEEERRKLILSKEHNYEQTLQQMIAICDQLEDSLSEHKYIASDSYSLADVVWTVFLARLFMIGFDEVITSRKNLFGYWQRVSARESYVKADIKTSMSKKLIARIMIALLFNI